MPDFSAPLDIRPLFSYPSSVSIAENVREG